MGKPGNNKENTMNKKHGLLFGFALIVIAAMFTLAGCNPDGTDSTDGGGIDSSLVGKWYSTQGSAEDKTNAVFEITAAGKLIAPGSTGIDISITAASGRTSISYLKNGQTVNIGAADYNVSGTILQFSNLSSDGDNYFEYLTEYHSMDNLGTFYKTGVDSPYALVLETPVAMRGNRIGEGAESGGAEGGSSSYRYELKIGANSATLSGTVPSGEAADGEKYTLTSIQTQDTNYLFGESNVIVWDPSTSKIKSITGFGLSTVFNWQH
jgi:hypothetical protein